jgi:hypothetical protein
LSSLFGEAEGDRRSQRGEQESSSSLAQGTTEDGAFGSSTPSWKKPLKPNSQEREKTPKGARPGHPGNGRKSYKAESADRIVEVQSDMEFCPECGGILEKKCIAERSVLDTPSGKPEIYPRHIVTNAGAMPQQGFRISGLVQLPPMAIAIWTIFTLWPQIISLHGISNI